LPARPDPTANKCDLGSLTIVANDTGPRVSVSVSRLTGIGNDYYNKIYFITADLQLITTEHNSSQRGWIYLHILDRVHDIQNLTTKLINEEVHDRQTN
jgi:hypothetical protein